MERRLAALLNADVVGYSRLMSKDEAGTLQALKEVEARLIEPMISEYKGRIVKRMGDGYLADFTSIVDAVGCAVAWQQRCESAEERSLRFRIGVHLGDIIVEGEDIYGDGVNISARLEALAEPGCVVISDDALRQVRGRVDAEFHDLGEHEVKNIPYPLRVWEWRSLLSPPRRLQNARLPATSVPSIVIMPFRNLTGDPAKEHLCDGLRMDIQNALVRVSGLFIMASGSAYALRGADAKQASSTFNVGYCLHGSIRAAGSRLRIIAELAEAATDRVVWSEQFNRVLDDSFDLQDEITGRVISAMNVKLVAGEQAKVWHKTLKDLKALEAFYKGVHAFYQMDREGMQRARGHFERVDEIRPNVPVGATWTAMTHWFDIQRGWSVSPERSKRLAREWAERAVAMKDADGQAQSVLSHLYLLDRRFDEALAFGREAIENRPTCAYANSFYANVLHYCDDQDEAIRHVGIAMRCQPLHPPFYSFILAAACRAKGELEPAATASSQALESSPGDIANRLILVSSYVGMGRMELASEAALEVRRLEPSFSIGRFTQAQPYRNGKFPSELASDLRAAGLPD
jgi:class 3 adenylate cyclase/TolB-like protein